MSKGGPKFKELRVWQKGKDLAVYIQKETFKFKEIEKGGYLSILCCYSKRR